MRTRNDSFFLIIIFVFTNLCYASHTLTSDDVSFENGTIKEYLSKFTDIIIPNKINGEAVKAIGPNAFRRKGIATVTLPNSLTVIGRWAFDSCNLETIIIPEGVKKIERFAFYDNNITDLTLPTTITKLELWAFQRNNIQTINGKPSGGFIYAHKKDGSIDTTNIVSFGRKEAKNLVIPHGVKTIGWNVFARMGITSLVIPKSVTYIECSAFGNNSIELLNGKHSNGIIYQRNKDGSEDHTQIMSFGGSSKVIDFIPDTVTYIASHSFMNSGIEKVTLPKNLKYIGWQAFRGNRLKEIVIPKGVTQINPFAFGNNDLTKVTILNENASVKKAAFNDNNIKTINGKSFDGFFYKQKKDGTKDLSTVVSYGKQTSENSTVTLPKHVTSIGDLAFASCSIGNFIIPRHITSIGKSVFDYRHKITKTLPSPLENTAYWINSKGEKVTKIKNLKLSYKVYYPPTCYTVSYNANGGIDGSLNSEKVIKGKTVKLLGNPSRLGFELNGWNSEADGGGIEYSNPFKVTANLTLYAQWEPTHLVTDNKTVAVINSQRVSIKNKTHDTTIWNHNTVQDYDDRFEHTILTINSGWNLLHVPETMCELWKNNNFASNDFWVYLEGNPFKGAAKYSKLSSGEIPLIGEGFWIMGTNSEIQNYEFDNQEYLNTISPVIELRKGWNIVGVEKPLPIKLNGSELWEWNAQKQDYKKYKTKESLIPTKGYWLFVTESGMYLKEDSEGKQYIISDCGVSLF